MPAGIRSGRSMATNREVAVQINRLIFFFFCSHTQTLPERRYRAPVSDTLIRPLGALQGRGTWE